jgi:hypothetical protein
MLNTSKKLLRRIILLPLLWICAACPYNSKVPIDEPRIKINENFLGTWEKSVNSKDYIEVKKLDNFHYLIEQFTAVELNRQFERKEFHAHISVVNNQQFLNVKQIPVPGNPSSVDNTFFIYRLDLSNPAEIRLSPLTEFIREQFNDSESLRRFVERHMSLSFFYEKDEIFRRKK